MLCICYFVKTTSWLTVSTICIYIQKYTHVDRRAVPSVETKHIHRAFADHSMNNAPGMRLGNLPCEQFANGMACLPSCGGKCTRRYLLVGQDCRVTRSLQRLKQRQRQRQDHQMPLAVCDTVCLPQKRSTQYYFQSYLVVISSPCPLNEMFALQDSPYTYSYIYIHVFLGICAHIHVCTICTKSK